MEQVGSQLYIGDLEDAGSGETLVEQGITAVVKLTHRSPATPYPDEITVADHRMIDGPQNDVDMFDAAVTEAIALRDDGETVLIHCKMGTSRSGAVTAAVLAHRHEMTVTSALDQIQRAKPDVDPHEALLRHARKVVE